MNYLYFKKFKDNLVFGNLNLFNYAIILLFSLIAYKITHAKGLGINLVPHFEIEKVKL